MKLALELLVVLLSLLVIAMAVLMMMMMTMTKMEENLIDSLARSAREACRPGGGAAQRFW